MPPHAMSHDELYEHPSPLEPITKAKSSLVIQRKSQSYQATPILGKMSRI
ncbi:MAG: hypothetical protein RR744_08960 [Cellulosilyticaceae bacterium]